MLAHEVDADTEDEPPALASDSEGDDDAPPPVSDPEVAPPVLARDSEGDDIAPPLVHDTDIEVVGRRGTILMTLADPDDMGETPPASPIWVMDSGASHHMTGAAGSLRSVAARAPLTIVLADGRRRTARTSGTAHLKVHGVAGALDLRLQDVLVVPGLTSLLLSVRQAALRGHKVILQRGGGVVIQNGNRPAIRGLLADKVYILPTIAETGTALAAVGKPTAAMWHHRFAHLGVTSLKRTAGAVAGMDLDKGELASLRATPCPPCIEGQMTRAPFPTLRTRTTAPLQVVHTDVAGPMEVPTPAGNTFFVGVIDDYTRFKSVFPIQTKGLAKEAVMTVVSRWENQTGHTVKVIRSNNGLEYTGTALSAWTAAKGIQRQTTTRYTPQSNGVAERYNRVVIKLTVAALAGCELDLKFGGESSVTINYLGNRVVGRGRTAAPYEMLYGARPDVCHLSPFACRAWVHVSDELRKKMQPRAVQGTFVGYGIDQRCYRVLVGHRIKTSRDVRFD